MSNIPFQTNMTMLPEYLRHVPAGAPTRQFIHYAQLIRSGRFARYDYGNREKNRIAYGGKSTPPDWRLDKVKVPVSTYWGKNDWLVNEKDYQRLLVELPNVIDNYTVPYDKWNHMDFAWGIDADKLLFPRVLENTRKAEERYRKEKEKAEKSATVKEEKKKEKKSEHKKKEEKADSA